MLQTENKKILIVDDYPPICALLKQTFEDLEDDYDVELYHAYSRKAAWQLIEQQQPNLIFLDITLEGKNDGYEILKAIKQDAQLKTIQVVLLTARGEKLDEEKGFEYGAIQFIKKPFSPNEVLELTYQLLGLEKQPLLNDHG